MNTQMVIELVGYVGSALVLVSFLMTSVFKLRIVNTVGSFIFMVYALIIHSYPTAIMNFCLVLINIHFLWKMRTAGKQYDLVELKKEDKYLSYLLQKQNADIEQIFPGLSVSPEEVDRAFLVTCNGAPAGLTLGKQEAEGEMELVLDYSLPEYRDFSIGSFLFNHLRSEGVKTLIYSGPTEHHITYLDKMGFIKNGESYIKEL